MRKSIRLTGRKQLPQSSFTITINGDGDGENRQVELEIADDWNGSTFFPPDSEIRVKLVESKLVEVLHFGTVQSPTKLATLTRASFRAPSCQLRIVSRAANTNGLLLASTKAWTLRSAGDSEGILLFQAADIQPRLWKLEIRSQEHPILYIDENVPNAALWAKTDPVFAACVLPHVISEVLHAVLANEDVTEGNWESDWARWTEELVPGSKPPFDGDEQDRANWIDDLVDAFSKTHNLARNVILRLEEKA